MGEYARTNQDYTVAWICALEVELAAAKALLDSVYPRLPPIAGDPNIYSFGAINGHNVVIACLPDGETGNNSAAAVANRMNMTFPSLKFRLMVGVGGGVPSLPHKDIRLGDVVVSSATGGNGGVVQWDRGKAVQGKIFIRTGQLNIPPEELRQAVTHLRANYRLKPRKLTEYLAGIVAERKDFASPAATSGLRDVLFNAGYDHPSEPRYDTCESCDTTQIVQRPQRTSDPVVHYGTIASGNQVMRNGSERDRISSELGGVLCFEMEAAGLMNTFPCLVIRGICDYSDSHKNEIWQSYAAVVAAAYAKELLGVVEPARLDRTQTTTTMQIRQRLGEAEAAKLGRIQTAAGVSTREVFGEIEPVRLNRTKTAAAVTTRDEGSWTGLPQTLIGVSRWVQAVAFSPNGQVLASASYDKTVQLWDTKTGDLRQTLTGHLEKVSAMSFSNNGGMLASIAKDAVRLWDAQTGDLRRTFSCDSNSVDSRNIFTKMRGAVAFSPDGEVLAFSSSEKMIQLRDTRTGVLRRTIKNASEWICAIKYSPDGRVIGFSAKDTVQLWNTETGALQQKLKGDSNVVNHIAFSRDEQLLASASSANTVQLWDVKTGALQHILKGHSKRVEALEFSLDGRVLASTSYDNTVRLWNAGTGALQQILEFSSDEADDKPNHPYAKRVGAVAFWPDGQVLAFTSQYHSIQRWLRTTV